MFDVSLATSNGAFGSVDPFGLGLSKKKSPPDASSLASDGLPVFVEENGRRMPHYDCGAAGGGDAAARLRGRA
jgi:hypothetical protein